MHKIQSGLDQCFMRQPLESQIVSKLFWSVFFAFTEEKSVIPTHDFSACYSSIKAALSSQALFTLNKKKSLQTKPQTNQTKPNNKRIHH